MGSVAAPESAPESERVALGFGDIVLRPLRPDDRLAYLRFLHRLAPEDVRLRMGHPVRADRRLYARLLDFDRSREEAFIALDGTGAIVGVARIVLDAGGEIALITRSDLKHRGIGEALLDRTIRFARSRGLAEICCHVLHENRPALNLARKHGCRLVAAPPSSLVALRCAIG